MTTQAFYTENEKKVWGIIKEQFGECARGITHVDDLEFNIMTRLRIYIKKPKRAMSSS